jgi:hypothetical protein
MNPIRVGLEVMSGDQRCKNMARESRRANGGLGKTALP